MSKLKKVGKWLGIGFGILVVAIGVLVAVAHFRWSSRIGATYETAGHDFEIPAITDENREEAHRLWMSRGCGECHGEDGAGGVRVDAPPFSMQGPNITGVLRTLSAPDIHRLVRRGVRPNGAPVFFMPAHEYQRMPDAELALIVAHARSLPQSDAQTTPSELHLLGRVLALVGVFDEMPLLPAEHIDMDAAFDPAGPDELGENISQGCRGCHGGHLSGGPIPGAPPELGTPLNLTPHSTGLEGWTLEQFDAALREGRKPDGTQMDRAQMPYHVYRYLSDAEVAALWAYLQTVEPREFGNR